MSLAMVNTDRALFLSNVYVLRVCVGNNRPNFYEFYKTLMAIGCSDWLFADRLLVGFTPQEREQSKYAAKGVETGDDESRMRGLFEQLTISHTNISRAQEKFVKQMNTVGEKMSTVGEKQSKNEDSIGNLIGYNKQYDKQVEGEVRGALVKWLETNGHEIVDELSDKRSLKLVAANGEEWVEWDGGVISRHAGIAYLFLVEAKHKLKSQHIDSIPRRVLKTKSLIEGEGVSSELKSGKTASSKYSDQRVVWSRFNGHHIHVVVGGPNVTELMKWDVNSQGYLCAHLKGAADYGVSPPASFF